MTHKVYTVLVAEGVCPYGHLTRTTGQVCYAYIYTSGATDSPLYPHVRGRWWTSHNPLQISPYQGERKVSVFRATISSMRHHLMDSRRSHVRHSLYQHSMSHWLVETMQVPQRHPARSGPSYGRWLQHRRRASSALRASSPTSHRAVQTTCK